MLVEAKARHNASGFITTQKDYIKLPEEFLESQNILVIKYSFRISDSDIVRERVRSILSL